MWGDIPVCQEADRGNDDIPVYQEADWGNGDIPVCGDTFRFVVINTNKAESLNKYYNTLIVNDFATFVKKPEIC